MSYLPASIAQSDPKPPLLGSPRWCSCLLLLSMHHHKKLLLMEVHMQAGSLDGLCLSIDTKSAAQPHRPLSVFDWQQHEPMAHPAAPLSCECRERGERILTYTVMAWVRQVLNGWGDGHTNMGTFFTLMQGMHQGRKMHAFTTTLKDLLLMSWCQIPQHTFTGLVESMPWQVMADRCRNT